jgi:hypothetical protein
MSKVIKLTVSRARAEDAEGILAVQHDVWLATYPSEELDISRAAIEGRVGNYQSPERIDKWRSIISDANEFVMVASDGPKV